MAEKMSVILGNTIRKERKARNLTQQELADITGISRRHIANIESGKINASFELIIAIVKELNISIDNIIYAELSNECQNNLQQMAVKLSRCSALQREIVLNTADYMTEEFLNLDLKR
ncbi:helix-turn-helix transcriptional regulator [Thomasclavelia sp.]|uniref:helix-turn-helix transcriptional regulator n=1 Tax=Thomasclavelia sp. TaxID=3025757 RepID=UPI0025E6EE35|nr:helix-turn-helix transcriptional regulator [Thomasclavelia sp.]